MITHEIIGNGNILKIYFEKEGNKYIHLILSKNNLAGFQSDYIKGGIQHNIIIHLAGGQSMNLKYDTWQKFETVLNIIDQWL